MMVIGIAEVHSFSNQHPECRQELAELVRELEAGDFATPHALKERYPKCKIIDGKTVVFKIRGNRYRLTAKIAYNTKHLQIVAVETHSQYDRRQL